MNITHKEKSFFLQKQITTFSEYSTTALSFKTITQAIKTIFLLSHQMSHKFLGSDATDLVTFDTGILLCNISGVSNGDFRDANASGRNPTVGRQDDQK